VRSFNQEEKDMLLKEIPAYLRDAQGTGVGAVTYDYHEFYAASRNRKADVFLCVETGKFYTM
jgi:hypothetical protein